LTDRSDKSARDAVLLYIQVPFHAGDGLHVESQAMNGLRLWAENFDRVIVMAPLRPGPPPEGWRPLAELGEMVQRIEAHPLPEAYRPDRFLRAYGPVRKKIGALIERSDYLVFAIGGLFGDWGAVASFEARRRKRPFAVWTDRVESEVVRRNARSGSTWKRMRARSSWRAMAALERAVIRRSALGLFHGRDTFNAYARWSSNPQLVHDIHIAPSDHITPEALRSKIDGVADRPLRIVYAGRAHTMKGPFDWLDALAAAAAAGVNFTAAWLGDGPELAEMRRRAAALGLDDRVDLPGFVSDRKTLLAALRAADLLLFCHKTPESPRILIEALISAAPIVGYRSDYAEDLTPDGGGVFVPLDAIDDLADRGVTTRKCSDCPVRMNIRRTYAASIDGFSRSGRSGPTIAAGQM
jgi:colanic acid/amylovoran biosynthesis glycosyltransferase